MLLLIYKAKYQQVFSLSLIKLNLSLVLTNFYTLLIYRLLKLGPKYDNVFSSSHMFYWNL